MPQWGHTHIMAGWAKRAFALLITMDVRLLTVVTLLWSTRLCRPAAFSLCFSGLICGFAFCTFALRKSRARVCLRELVLPIAVDIQGSQISFCFADRGDLPPWSTRLWRLEWPSLWCLLTYDWAGHIFFCFDDTRLGDLAGPIEVDVPPWSTDRG